MGVAKLAFGPGAIINCSSDIGSGDSFGEPSMLYMVGNLLRPFARGSDL